MSPTPAAGRDRSQDQAESKLVKHNHAQSESGRSSVPMWDSSDPDRAPPPLPLNPSLTNSPISKPHTSANIEKAAALIAARALENTPSSYTSNPPPSSPDKSMSKSQHRRIHTIQDGSVSRLSDSLERRSPEKSLRASKLARFEDYRSSRSLERTPGRSGSETPTPMGRGVRRHSDENTPPPTNMLALQLMSSQADNEPALRDITNGALQHPPSVTFDAISTQILNVTEIVTNLQKEMTKLSTRSKDNASDLMSLREATSNRDEDIRRSLKDLVAGMDKKIGSIDSRLRGPEGSRSTPNLPLMLDDKEHTPTRNSFNLPRIASPSGFLDRELTASPSVVSVDGAASIAMLEKVLREMATKDGQDKLMTSLELVKSRAGTTQTAVATTAKSTIDPTMMQKLEEILVFMKDMKADSGSRALVRAAGLGTERSPSQMELYLEKDRQGKPVKSSGVDGMNDEVVKTLRVVKQSLSQHGGLTNEIKALVRELRGEVLGMGRDIAQKLDRPNSTARDTEKKSRGPDQTIVLQVVEQGIADLKEHIHHVVEQSVLQSASTGGSVDSAEVVGAVRTALSTMPPQTCSRDVDAEREYLLSAVREAWEECKPEVALEHFGLERDEILQTLKEGLESYQPEHLPSQAIGVTYEQVLAAVQEGLADFHPPQIAPAAGASKDEVLSAVQECLENFDFPLPRTAPTESSLSDMSRDIVMDAVREVFSNHTQSNHLTKGEILETVRDGLHHQAPSVTKEIEFNREDLFDAIKACLEGEQNPLGGMGERVVDAMHEFLGSMKTEFQQYSAANGRDTEQVLDAIKDGLEDLRAQVENYVDRASDVTGKDEIIDNVKAGFAATQADMDKVFAICSQKAPNTNDFLDAMEKEFEHLRETIRKSMAGLDMSADKSEILDAIRDISDDQRSSLSGNSEDVVRLVKDELEHMRTTLATTLIKSGSSIDRHEVLDAIREGLDTHRSVPRAEGTESILSNTSELLDAFQEGVDSIRADMQRLIDKPTDLSANEDILDTVKAGIDSIRQDMDLLKSKGNISDDETIRGHQVVLHDENAINTQLEALKVMITQLRIKVEAIDIPVAEPIFPSEMRVHKEDLDEIHAALHRHARKEDVAGIHATLREMQESVNNLPRKAPEIALPEVAMPENAATKDDTDAIETLLHNVKAKLEDMIVPSMETVAKASHITSIEHLLKEMKTAVDLSAESTNREDFTIVELLLKDIASSVEGLETKIGNVSGEEGKLSRVDLEVLESLCMDIKCRIEDPKLPDMKHVATKDDITDVKDSIRAFREQLESDNDLSAQAFEARKIEHGGLASKIDDVRNIMADIREELIGKLNGSEEGIVELSKVLGMHHDNMSTYATAASISELSQLVNKAFDSQWQHHVGSRTEMEERDATLFSKYQDTSDELKAKIEHKFTELMTKYDDAQMSNNTKLNSFEDRDRANVESIASVKGVVEELRSLMNTLGSTVSDSCEKVSHDSRTVFDIVDQTNNKIGDLETTNTQEHVLTRDDIAKTLAATSRLEDLLQENQPHILAAVREVLEKVGRHFEHSQQQGEKFIQATEEIKTGMSAIPEAIPPLLPALPPVDPTYTASRQGPTVQDYEDSDVHAKLDELVAQSALAKEAFTSMDAHHTATHERLASLEKLDGIHEKVSATAQEISSMVAVQTRLMTENHESRAEEAREAAIALEKRTAQKERVEADIFALGQEKNALVESMAALRREHEELAGQTKRLTRDVAKLETALSIRQEEMRTMNARAESLERRVLEGVMNHARSIKLTKTVPKKKISPAERDASMNLKRVPSNASNVTAKASTRAPSSIGNAVGMALKKRTPLGSASNANGTSRASVVDRRIVSTSHVPGSRPSEVNRAVILAPAPTAGLVSLKRSQSVKSNPSSYLSGRKPSWNGFELTLADKENHSVAGDDATERSHDDDGSSDTETERRTSFSGTSYMYTDSAISRSSMRSTSYASSLNGTINGHGPESIAEEDDESDHDVDNAFVEETGSSEENPDFQAVVLAQPQEEHVVKQVDVAGDELDEAEERDTLADLPSHSEVNHHESKFTVASDSGIGSEPPTPDQSVPGWQSAIST